MSEYKQRANANEVSHDVYIAALRYRADAADLSDSLAKHEDVTSIDDDDTPRHRFILRLLNADQLSAFDRLVILVSVDDLGHADRKRNFVVSARPLMEEAIGRLESHYVNSDGLIFDKEDAISENGYYLDAQGVDEDEFRNVARVQLRRPEAKKVMQLPLPDESSSGYNLI